MMCRHCNTRPANRRRGLCWKCYDIPEVRDLYAAAPGAYPPTDTLAQSRPASEPTDAPPRSDRKVDAMCERARRRESLFHPRDGWGPVDLS